MRDVLVRLQLHYDKAQGVFSVQFSAIPARLADLPTKKTILSPPPVDGTGGTGLEHELLPFVFNGVIVTGGEKKWGWRGPSCQLEIARVLE
ncbi:hypothetical protein J6590_067662 [Homalodisca vitripennis]|nr:hypothetical protein J6590_067662 [Homalodisca vitripennis]